MFYEYWGFDEWSTIATIGLSVIAIVIAILSSRSTSKAADKQIGEMQKQICEIKNLSVLQIDTTTKLVEVEIQKTIANVKLYAQEAREIDEINNSGLSHIVEYRNDRMREYQEKKPSRELQIHSESLHNLNEILKGLNELKNRLG